MPSYHTTSQMQKGNLKRGLDRRFLYIVHILCMRNMYNYIAFQSFNHILNYEIEIFYDINQFKTKVALFCLLN